MRIACLVTVCAAFSSTLHFAKAVNLVRRPKSETHLVERDSEGAENDISSEVKSILVQPIPVTASRRIHPGAHVGGFRKARAIRPNRTVWRGRSLNRLRLDRQRRHLQRSNARSIRAGRSYEINENQIETIQSSEAFEPGAIRIEPMFRVVKKKNVLDKIVDLVRSVINPSKSLGPLVGPIHVPGLGEKVFVRLLEPLESKHLMIRVVTNLPVPEIESSVHHNVFPAPGVVEHVETPLVDHSSSHLSIDPVWSLPTHHSHGHSSLATESVHSSSNHVVRVAQPTSSGLKQISNNPSAILHNPRILKVNLKYSEPIAESGHGHHDQLFPTNGAYHGSVHYRNEDRHSETSGTNDQKFGSSESTENKSHNEKFQTENQFQAENQFQDSSYYLDHSDQYRDKFTSSWNRSNIETVPNVKDAEAGESLNPLYVANVDVPSLGAGTRTGRVASLDGSFSTSRPETETAFRIVKAPILLPTMASHLHLSQNFSSDNYANTDAPFRPMKYLNLNSSVWSSKPRASSGYGNGSGYTLFLGNGTTQNVPIPANLYSEAIRRRDSRIREIVKLTEDIRRNLNKTQTKRNVNIKSFDMFPRLTNKTSNVTVARKNVGIRMHNVPARNVSVTKVSSRNVPVPKVSSRKVSSYNVSIPKVSSRNIPTYNVSLRNATTRNVQADNSSKNANISHENEGPDCVKCQDSKEYENFESDEYEDYYYDDETDISNSTQSLKETVPFSTTLKSLLSTTSTEPTVERGNLKSQPDTVKKNSTASKVD